MGPSVLATSFTKSSTQFLKVSRLIFFGVSSDTLSPKSAVGKAIQGSSPTLLSEIDSGVGKGIKLDDVFCKYFLLLCSCIIIKPFAIDVVFFKQFLKLPRRLLTRSEQPK